MLGQRMRRSIDALLDEAELAASANEWPVAADKARTVLSADPDNEDAKTFLGMAVANGIDEVAGAGASESGESSPDTPASELTATSAAPDPESFAGGRYKVLRFLGEGGKQCVFLAHDALLDRDIAFSLSKTDGLDDTGRERIMREARAMGRLTNANIVSNPGFMRYAHRLLADHRAN